MVCLESLDIQVLRARRKSPCCSALLQIEAEDIRPNKTVTLPLKSSEVFWKWIFIAAFAAYSGLVPNQV
jgi:hypothetical protein